MLLSRKSLGVLRSTALRVQSPSYKTLSPSSLLSPSWKQQVRSFSAATPSYVQSMYDAWRADNASVHPSWDKYFKESGGAAPAVGDGPKLPGDLQQQITDSMRLTLFVRAYQVRGHAIANLDPLGLDKREEPPELHPSKYGFNEADLDREIYIGHTLLPGFLSAYGTTTTMRKMQEKLRAVYCGTIGVEYTHMQERERLDWMRERFETATPYSLSNERKRKILQRLAWAVQFENFLGKKYKGTRRFGLDGGESVIAGLKALIDDIADRGVNGIVIGMPHRGRLNVLANVVRKPLSAIFHEFEGGVITAEDDYSSGDVKYHLGTSYDCTSESGKKVHLSLVANPSHLEAVNPVVEGKVRAKQFYKKDTKQTEILPLIMHGDAAFAGQGVVYETLDFSDLPSYSTGGTIHVIVNNQIGFTTDPKSSRSSLYPTDVALGLGVPIFHVNGDDPEAVVRVFELAADWRQTFHKDVIVDVVCYRQYGHNEIDMPHFTQPLMYQKIDKHPDIFQLYSEKLISTGVMTKAEVEKLLGEVNAQLEKEHQASQQHKPGEHDWLSKQWVGFKGANTVVQPRDTGVDEKTLQKLGKVIATIPSDFTPHNTIKKIYAEKEKMLAAGAGFDWATAEALAFGSLLTEGTHVRLSGQDVERGTFSHRHAVIHDQKDGHTYTALENLDPKQAVFSVSNSSLSEFGVLGFELGYSLESPHALVLWEAQFGDFANGAQVMIDQFISSGEQKWMRQSGLVMLLPHGYDGAGPEHSSARLERFLTACDANPFNDPKLQQKYNWQIVYCTTPANYFHVLRRQILREYRKPLIVFMSKYLLRYTPSFSSIAEFTNEGGYSRFRTVIPEATPEALLPPQKVDRIVFCSGQVYYSLLKARQDQKINNVAIVRLEQLYPFPFDLVTKQLELYPNADLYWCQEEPMNMGAWTFVSHHLYTAADALGSKRKHPAWPKYSGRPGAASPAVASVKLHQKQLDELLEGALVVKK